MTLPTTRVTIFLLLIVDLHATNTVTSAKEECRKRIAECTINGGGSIPVCGSDGITYSNQCQIISKQCQGLPLLIKHTGPCPETPACFSARLTTRLGVQPVCQHDGTYAPIQCHTETGYCWCVTPQGRPLPDTSVRHHAPRCFRLDSKSPASTRSGQTRHSPRKQRRQYSSNRHRNTCDRMEKSKFNENLIENFKIEYRRINISVDVLKSSPTIHPLLTFNGDLSDTKEEGDANDCMSDRRSVLEDQKQNSQEKFYIPQCTSDGRYYRVQCYSGYCWCVYQDTGKPIPGTSSKNRTPNCNPVPTPSRPIKGCPEFRKQLFLRDLMDLMQEKMTASNTDSDETTAKWQASKEERIATWHFVMLDKNKNKVLEKKEWKSFRTMVANNRQLRRCGKKLPKYCDINNDRRISMTEWLSCLNAQHTTTVNDLEKPSTIQPRRLGPNPLDQLLNDDD